MAALTADLNLAFKGTVEVNEGLAGAADTLFKGALLNYGTDGLLKVYTDTASESFAGVAKKQVIALGSNVETVELINGRIEIVFSAAAQTDVGVLFFAGDDQLIAVTGTNVAIGVCVAVDVGVSATIDTRRRAI